MRAFLLVIPASTTLRHKWLELQLRALPFRQPQYSRLACTCCQTRSCDFEISLTKTIKKDHLKRWPFLMVIPARLELALPP